MKRDTVKLRSNANLCVSFKYMTLMLAILGAIVGAVLGAACGFLAVIALAALAGVSDPSGGVEMGAATTGLPVGAVIGAVSGLALVLYLRRSSGKKSPRQELAAGVMLILAVSTGLTWLNYVPPVPTLKHPVYVDLEFRIPTEQIALGPHQEQVTPQLLTMQTHLDPETLSITEEGETTFVAATHRLRFATDDREIVMAIATARYVVLDLPASVTPEASNGFSDWRPADHVRQNYYAQDEPEGHGISYRIRIRHP